MRKNIFNLSILSALVLMVASCSQDFLDEKRNYDNVSTEVYDYASGVEGRLNFIYNQCLADANSGITWKTPSTGTADDAGKSTEEYSGFSVYLDPQTQLTTDGNGGTKVPDYYQNVANNVQASAWGKIRNINDFLAGVENGKLSRGDKDKYEGQAYFFRAWCYYNFVKWYGGVPIVREVLEPDESTFVPRSSARECIEFICEDLDSAIVKLSSVTAAGGWNGGNWGRVSAGTAAALRGRALLLWCSPLFNRANEQSRWTEAYEQMKEDLIIINANGYGLYNDGNNVNASAWASMFCQSGVNPEAVFVTLYNNILGDGLDIQKNNSWERGIRPSNTTGSGKEASAMIVDLFPMVDGKLPQSAVDYYSKLPASDSAYNKMYPFMNRDPRFYRTFAFPGVRWAFSGDASKADKNNPQGGADYALWNYVWYTDQEMRDKPMQGTSYGADNLLGNKKGVYVRKRSDDRDVNSPLYTVDTLSVFQYSAAPYIELRYAEVLLNLAEVACGAGDYDGALEYVREVRRRVGYTGDCGIPALTEGACMSAILYERMIELAYEGKRFDDMRRWLLFDGGTQFNTIEGCPQTWLLTGWGGNTCEWLGVKQFNGQRRENMEFRVQDQYGLGTTTVAGDPLVKAGVVRCEPIDYRKPLYEQTLVLKDWYNKYLIRKDKKGDSYDSNENELKINFLPRYYFLGLASGPQSNNKGLPQMIGWGDYNNGGSNGTFDPLSE